MGLDLWPNLPIHARYFLTKLSMTASILWSTSMIYDSKDIFGNVLYLVHYRRHNFRSWWNVLKWYLKLDISRTEYVIQRLRFGNLSLFRGSDPWANEFIKLALSCLMLKNSQRSFENLAVFTAQDFKSMFGHF